MCVWEVWTLRKSDANILALWERKILGKLFGLVKENYVWRIFFCEEFMDLCRESRVISEVSIGKLRYLELVEKIPEGKL
jgi:hypothetical protein